MSEGYIPPTPDEIRRVSDYWARVKAMTCKHPEIKYGPGEDLICSDCNRPIRILSDIQLQGIEAGIKEDREWW